MSGEAILDLNSVRAKKARLAAAIGPAGGRLLWLGSTAFAATALGIWLSGGLERLSFGLMAGAVLALIAALWYQRDLKHLPSSYKAKNFDGMIEPVFLAKLGKTPPENLKVAWQAATSTWEGRFLCNHLLIDAKSISSLLSDENTPAGPIWHMASQLAAKYAADGLDGGCLAAVVLQHSVMSKKYLSQLNLTAADVEEVYGWLSRLKNYINQPHPYFGGIGRDWAAGFTPSLDRLGQNISRQIERGGGHFHTLAHADVLDGIVHSLGQGTGSVALVGETGTGKTSLVYALAQRLLHGDDQQLLYYQVFSLSASAILSSEADDLERVLLTLFGEAVHAGNIILFLDDAELFFGEGTGAFDLSQVLLPVLQNHRVKIIAALTPHSFQSLKSTKSSLISQITPITIKEPDELTTIGILEDTALGLEQKEHLLVGFQAVREAYRLSGQFDQDMAYPGKAISLLEQSTAYAADKIVTAESVQQAVEKTKGVRVSKAQAPEAEVLLKLEELIHRRMINQERAVKVVSAALRRGRAGVSNPNRPVGSFLFLGPTGVGKTELARSLAATYFGDEYQMVRLDMSEYQQPQDVSRLLDAGNEKTGSLVMSIRQQPFSVVLLDELEKSDAGVLNLLLQMLDEGQLTDQNGRPASFKNAIIIATSNAGSAEISQRVAAGDSLEEFERPLVDKLIAQGIFKAELINRFDEVVLFRPLNEQELTKVAGLMLQEVNKTLANQNVKVQLTDAALTQLVKAGYDPQFGARPMRRAIQKMVEDAVAKKVLAGQAEAGTTITLDVADLS